MPRTVKTDRSSPLIDVASGKLTSAALGAWKVMAYFSLGKSTFLRESNGRPVRVTRKPRRGAMSWAHLSK